LTKRFELYGIAWRHAEAEFTGKLRSVACCAASILRAAALE
jgi:hypothetical protein